MTCIGKIEFVSSLELGELVKALGMKAGYPDGAGSLCWLEATHKEIPKIVFYNNEAPGALSAFRKNKTNRRNTLIRIRLDDGNEKFPFDTLLLLTSKLQKLEINPIIFCQESQITEETVFEKTRTLNFTEELWGPVGERDFILEDWLTKFKV